MRVVEDRGGRGGKGDGKGKGALNRFTRGTCIRHSAEGGKRVDGQVVPPRAVKIRPASVDRSRQSRIKKSGGPRGRRRDARRPAPLPQ